MMIAFILFILFISIYRYNVLKTQICMFNDIDIEDQRTGKQYLTQKYFGVHQFLTEYSKSFGEDQPNCTDIYLPSCVTRASVYDDYKLQCEVEERPYLHISRFHKIWNLEFSHVKIRKVSI